MYSRIDCGVDVDEYCVQSWEESRALSILIPYENGENVYKILNEHIFV